MAIRSLVEKLFCPTSWCCQVVPNWEQWGGSGQGTACRRRGIHSFLSQFNFPAYLLSFRRDSFYFISPLFSIANFFHSAPNIFTEHDRFTQPHVAVLLKATRLLQLSELNCTWNNSIQLILSYTWCNYSQSTQSWCFRSNQFTWWTLLEIWIYSYVYHNCHTLC